MMRTLLPKNPLRRLARQFTHWQPRRVRELARDTDAAIAPMVAVLGGSLVLAAGLALDITLYIRGCCPPGTARTRAGPPQRTRAGRVYP